MSGILIGLLAAASAWVLTQPGARGALFDKNDSTPRDGDGRPPGWVARYLPSVHAKFAGKSAEEQRAHIALMRVITGLHSGMPVRQAWLSGAQLPLDGLGLPASEPLAELLASSKQHAGRAQRSAGEIRAACALAQELGLPLAGVLEAQLQALADEQQTDRERQVALAGPRMTARVLMWLPLAGLGLGALMGADPLAVLLGGGIGTFGLLLGAGLIWLGSRWVRRLIMRAQNPGVA